ncbi:MAG: RagB/SusD family nutrient uptake outer membrane protein [Bacteroidota bacterium]|uniref:SusD, outer membrane protein n=1 Tax=Christiangramia flava JLT2011 TaxID=1229726 RepID=A0A1L7I8U6_9FLAO|nr:RagB/SusD family nutrient uptake outer membrane protein [Christiangramia flava]APU69633.1 SusD, outer membrane protein [Christiangramia flava JLT2011]MAM19307.1 RagB/SusD family nutrient uptake outer membrane protein [Christiangramia sp.]MEE2771086.1 RagB/SusD family nutrient uptake outer membrane protein [Bacteroidota bacterium]OSS39336.1 SusD, outer membrane protein [Christiangramia flava JLT2011]
MKNYRLNLIVAAFCALGISSCTDLEIEETDSIIVNQTGEFTGVSDVDATLNGIYDAVRGQLENQANLYALNEVSSDEYLVPTRGTDWGDNGVWRTLHQHSWSPIHPYVRDVWNEQNSNVFRTTEVIDSRSNPSASQEAEARFLRAFSMFWVMDLYGQVPFREPDEGIDVDPRVLTRTEAFDFIVNDLNVAVSNLEAVGPGTGTNKATKAAAHFLLAKLYLNKHIYTGSGSPAASDMQEVVSHVDAIEGMGFGLVDGYFGIFSDKIDNETIWYTNSGVGNVIWNTLHYNQTTPANSGGGWNGFTTLSEFYDLFEGDPNSNYEGDGQEERRGFVPKAGSAVGVDFDGDGVPDDLDEDGDGMLDGSQIGFGLLIGQQYAIDGSKLQAEVGKDLIFTKELPGLLGNGQSTGVRMLKYHPSNGSYTGHKIIFRYADALLMKAEAAMNGGGGDALEIVNELRTIRKATPLTSVSADDLIDERGREMYGEFWRRNDLIRFGKFTETWEFKDNTEEFRTLFPIPASAIISNPNLTQNPGY